MSDSSCDLLRSNPASSETKRSLVSDFRRRNNIFFFPVNSVAESKKVKLLTLNNLEITRWKKRNKLRKIKDRDDLNENSIKNISGSFVNIFSFTQFHNVSEARCTGKVRKISRVLKYTSTTLSLSGLCCFESWQQHYFWNMRFSVLGFYQQNPRQRQTSVVLLWNNIRHG